MKNRTSAMAGLLSVCVLMSVLLGCGGGNPPAQPTSQPTATAPTASGNQGGKPFADTVLKVGRIPFANASEMVVKHEGLLKYLKSELGIKEARLVLANDYQGILTKLGRGEIDIGWLGSLPYVDGKEQFKLKPLVKPVRFDTVDYRGVIITRQDSGIKSLADLKGKKFAWVEKESASGYIFPRALIIEAGVNPEKDFVEHTFLNKHDAVVLNVYLGKYDAGACYDDARKTLKDANKMNELTILARTQNIANEPIVCREDFPADLAERIRQAFLKLDKNNIIHKKVMEDLTDVQGFVPANDKDYDYVRKMAKYLQTDK
jgi:phosphate/phosphite/phosphonate ABC transporter binding protein